MEKIKNKKLKMKDKKWKMKHEKLKINENWKMENGNEKNPL